MKVKVLAFAVSFFALAQTSFASLGNPTASISNDGTPVTATTKAQSLAAIPAGVTTSTVRTPDGVIVTEYATQGVVFAISWQGQTMPNLKQLLSNTFPTSLK